MLTKPPNVRHRTTKALFLLGALDEYIYSFKGWYTLKADHYGHLVAIDGTKWYGSLW